MHAGTTSLYVRGFLTSLVMTRHGTCACSTFASYLIQRAMNQ